MMRLIDADAMNETLKRKYPQLFTEKPKDSWMHYAWLVYYWAVENAPTVDAVPVVRCKDCRWWENSEDSLFGYCMAMKHGYMSENWEIGIYRLYKGDFYCADAERKEDD